MAWGFLFGGIFGATNLKVFNELGGPGDPTSFVRTAMDLHESSLKAKSAEDKRLQ